LLAGPTRTRDTFEDVKAGMMAAYATGDCMLQQIANAFGVHDATVSRVAIRKWCYIARPDTLRVLVRVLAPDFT
jgi:hypothetical protein